VAPRGSSKAFSERHERHIAHVYNGVRSPSSGGAAADRGDVRTERELFECKHTGAHHRPARSISVKLDDLEKIFDEAVSEGKMPVMALSLYCPSSVLAGPAGFVDLTLRLTSDDAERSEALEYYAGRGAPAA
jgi:hypothetical protein